MDISGIALSSYQNDNSKMQVFSTGMLSKAIDQQEMAGAMTAKMIASAPSPSLESMVNPSQGTQIDMRV